MKILKEKVHHVGQWNMLEDDAGNDGDGDVEGPYTRKVMWRSVRWEGEALLMMGRSAVHVEIT